MSISPVKSAVRVLEVFDYFRRERRARQLKEICEALNYPQSSGTALLKNLVTLGYLSYDRTTRNYFPTLKIAALGDWLEQALFGQSQIFEVMRDLHSASGEAVSVALQNDVYMQYIHVIQSIHPLRFHTEEGSMRPLTLSATGWVLMSAHPDREVDRLIRRANIATQPVADRQPMDLMMQRVREARAAGHAYAENLPLLGGATLCVMLPLKVQGRSVVLGMGGALERIRPRRQEYLQLMQDLVSSLNESASIPEA
ncbi:IclR family transcriptional regulator [Ottowia thiooxydans]|uniref:IclR family transcriptional regulator n=1 Tax=Ottowia thiooxydans TaxID=219182 RepID=UPI0003FD0334|nr:helix-turn-helix domain-containing protein [Ottowia thiooxydans]